jgi:serine/threonine protein kinase
LKLIDERYRLDEVDEKTALLENILYEAVDIEKNESVYLEFVRKTDKLRRDFAVNLLDETAMISFINSPYMLKVDRIGRFSDEGEFAGDNYLNEGYYIVYEYVQAVTLAELIHRKQLSIQDSAKIAIQVLKSLELMHGNGMYHGALKPQCILIDDSFNVKVSGFGIVHANNGINNRSEVNLQYICPHQLIVDLTDYESDFFALGQILFESVFKVKAFGESTVEEERLKKINKGVSWYRLNYEVHRDNDKELIGALKNKEFMKILKRLLSRDVGSKYSHSRNIIIDLSELIYD